MESIARAAGSRAQAALEQAMDASPDDLELWGEGAAWFREQGEVVLAEEKLSDLLARHGHDPYVRLCWSTFLANEGRFDESLSVLDGLLAELPDDQGLLHHQAETQRWAGRYEEAIASSERLLAVARGNPTAYAFLAATYEKVGDPDRAWQTLQSGLAMHPDDYELMRFRTAMSNYRDDLTNEEHFAIHRAFGSWVEAAIPPMTSRFPHNPSPNRKLRLGYLSPDFRRHSVAQFCLDLIRQHDRENFEVTLYMVAEGDEITPNFEAAADRFRLMTKSTALEIADQIRADKIDVLVDLAGHSTSSLASLMVSRPAPVQFTYLGYASTTGFSRIQYRLVDTITDPPGSEQYASEELFRLPGMFLCFQPLDPLPVVPRADSTPAFGCFGNPSKITRSTVELWARALRAAPQAKLILANLALGSSVAEARIRRFFDEEGIDQARIDIRSKTEDRKSFLQMYGEVDVALDAHPYNGTTTTFEVFGLGIPTVTLAGVNHRSRVGASILTHLGHPEWVATSKEEFGHIAGELIQDRFVLDRLRLSLPRELKASPHSDPAAFAVKLEDAFIEAWERWCSHPI